MDVNVVFTPSTLGQAEQHSCFITFASEKVGKLSYELCGIGLEPDTQDPINITSEIGNSQMVVVNFRNSTDTSIICDIQLLGYILFYTCKINHF